MTNTITVDEALELLHKDQALLIDVREADEYKAEHIAWALSIPLSQLEQGLQSMDLPVGKTLLFQCLRGGRGEMACQRAEKLENLDNKVANLGGGLVAWKAAGQPVIVAKQRAGSVSIFRQVQIIVGLLMMIFIAAGLLGLPIAFYLAGFLGFALFFAGLSGWCGLAMILGQMPWNK